jgi:replicative DNA helicase
MATLEEMILENLIANEEYSRKIVPFLKPEYFEEEHNKLVFQTVHEFIDKYNVLPPLSSLEYELKNALGTRQQTLDACLKTLHSFSLGIDHSRTSWLIDKTEQWVQERAIFLAIHESIKIMDGKSKSPKTAIPQLLSDALAVGFDSNLGHDFLNDSDHRYEFINSNVPRMPCDLYYYNLIMGGGVPRKTLNLIGGGVNVGKTLQLCHLACAYALLGYKVVYFTLEMAEEEIAKRFDANLLDYDINKLKDIPKAEWDSKITKIKQRAKGNIIIKEYPTRAATAIQFRAFLRELKIKKNFVPDIVMIDYLGICASSKIKLGGSVNTNTYQGHVASEIRAMAIEMNIAIWSAQQLNRTGFSSSDPDMDNTADSWDIAGIADFYIMVTQSEDLAKLNQYQVKQVKSRYGDKNRNKRFVIGVDKDHMRLYDVAASAQTLTNASGGRNTNAQASSPTKTSHLDEQKRQGRNSSGSNAEIHATEHGRIPSSIGNNSRSKGKFNDFKL